MTDAPNPTGFSDGLRNLCRKTCAECFDPPCFMLPELCEPCDHITPCEECLTAAIAELVEGLGILADCVDDGCFASEMEMATVMDNAHALIAKYAVEE